MSRDLLTSTMKAGRPVADVYRNLLTSMLAQLAQPRSASPCKIPEKECPPYCVCRIAWDAGRGEHLRAVVRVTNTGKHARTFSFVVAPFQGPSGDTGVSPQLTPDTAVLEPNQSQAVTLDLDVGENLQSGGTYTTEMKIRGLYEQCVQLSLQVHADQVAQCEVSQGEMPMHVHAHNWYDHFLCEEPGFEQVNRRDDLNPQG